MSTRTTALSAKATPPIMTAIRRAALFFLMLAVLAVCAGGIYLYLLKRRADHVVDAAYALSLQKRPPALQELRQRFGGALRQPTCTPYGCDYDVFLSNRVLAAVHLVPYAALRLSFWVENGAAASSSLDFWTTAGERGMVLSHVLVKYCDRCDTFQILPFEDSSYLGTSGSIEIGYRSAANKKRLALSLNTGCLTGLRGCATIPEMFPKLWQLTPAGNISCRIPNREGAVQ
jgi:hypothetical protein